MLEVSKPDIIFSECRRHIAGSISFVFPYVVNLIVSRSSRKSSAGSEFRCRNHFRYRRSKTRRNGGKLQGRSKGIKEKSENRSFDRTTDFHPTSVRQRRLRHNQMAEISSVRIRCDEMLVFPISVLPF